MIYEGFQPPLNVVTLRTKLPANELLRGQMMFEQSRLLSPTAYL